MQNESGLRPVEFKVLIKPDPVEERTEGGIIMPEQTKDMQQMAQVKGTLVAYGGAAFGKPFTDDERVLLVPGARVYYDKYAGTTLIGADGADYIITQDKNVASLVENEAAVPISALRGRSRKGLDAA